VRRHKSDETTNKNKNGGTMEGFEGFYIGFVPIE